MPLSVVNLNPDVVVVVSHIERDVEFAQPQAILQRRGFSGTHSTIQLEKNRVGELAARKYMQKAYQEILLGDTRNLATAEVELLRAVTGIPHMPTFLGSAQANDVVYFYYKPWGTRTLRQFLDHPSTNHPCHTHQQLAAQYMLCLSRALHLLHASRPPIMHRDLKPENFMLTEDDEIFVMDFGVGKLCVVDSTASSSYVRTKDYMAPEIVRVLSGLKKSGLDRTRKKRPYSRCVQRVQKFMDAVVQANPNVAAYKEMINQMLAENPLDRPTFAEVHEHLRELQPSYSCCADELPYEDEDSIDSQPTTDSTSSSDNDFDEIVKDATP
ncbi:hypothetical protein HK102_000283 [Quaeritorhiza haematococci]|nr:hypothetical protein HK102_000283 [Quaeritorhiza haematococci]